MDRRDWLKKLQMELYRMPRNEIDDAVAYYSEYFEEAGPEREQEIISELGDPAKVAAQIKADYAVRQLDDLEREEARGERGRFWNRFSRRDPNESWQEHVGNTGAQGGYGSAGASGGYTQAGGSSAQGYGQTGGNAGAQGGYGSYSTGAYSTGADGYRAGYNNGYTDARQTRPKSRVGVILAAIIGGILAAPIAFPVAFLLIGLAMAAVVCIGAIIVSLFALAIGGVVGGIGLLISAFLAVGTTGAGMLVIVGTGLVIVGMSVLLGFLVIKGAAALIRAIGRGVANRRRRKQMAGGYRPGAYQSRYDGGQKWSAGYRGDAAQSDYAQAADGWQESAAQSDYAQAADGWQESAAQSDSAQTANGWQESAAQSDSAQTANMASETAAQGDSAMTDSPAASDGEVNEDAGK